MSPEIWLLMQRINSPILLSYMQLISILSWMLFPNLASATASFSCAS